MPKYIIAKHGNQYHILEYIGEMFEVIATSTSFKDAETITQALNFTPEPRLGYADLR